MSVKKLLNEPIDHIKHLEKLVERQDKQIQQLRKPRVSLLRPRGKKVSGRRRIQVICGDSHGAYHDPDAVAAFLSDVRRLQPSQVVHVGDALDCAGFLSSHGVMGVVPELDYTFEQDVLCANDFLDGVQKAAPNAKVTLIEGNHERRIKRQIYKFVIRNPKDAKYMLSMFGPESVLNTEKRGVRYIHRDKFYDGLSVSGTVKVEPHCVAQHGEAYCGQNAAFRHLSKLGRTVYFGHSHRLIAVYGENIDHTIAAFNTGCLCRIRPLYGMTKTTDWTHGYVLRVSTRDGFLSFPIPIVCGVSFLSCLASLLNI